jgi:hypothetical protein
VITFLLLTTCLVPGRERALRISFVLLGAGVSATTLLKFINNSYELASQFNGPRYSYIPQLMLLWIAVSMCFTRYIPIAAAWLFVFIITYPTNFFQRHRDDKQWSSYTADIGMRPVTIPIYPNGWFVTVPMQKPVAR